MHLFIVYSILSLFDLSQVLTHFRFWRFLGLPPWTFGGGFGMMISLCVMYETDSLLGLQYRIFYALLLCGSGGQR